MRRRAVIFTSVRHAVMVVAIGLLTVSVAACSEDGQTLGGGGGNGGDSGNGGENLPPVLIDVDANRTGEVELGSGAPKTSWSDEHGAIFIANADNDTNQPNFFMDLFDDIVNGPNDVHDLAPIVLRELPDEPELTGGSARVEVGPSGSTTYVRIFQNFGGNWTMVYDPADPAPINIDINDLLAGDVELGLESRARHGPGWDARVDLTFIVEDDQGSEFGSDEASMWLAPWIMASNTWPVEQLIIADLRGTGQSANNAFYDLCEQVCQQAGVQFVPYPGSSYGNDRWIQDSQEPGVVLYPGPNNSIQRMDITLQMPRNRSADDWCLDEQPGPGFGVFPKFINDAQTSIAAGGNLELVPPLPNDPWGRILVGEAQVGNVGETVTGQPGGHDPAEFPSEYHDFWNESGIQGPVESISSEWLVVGHIDEFLMFTPAPNVSRGWALLFADPDMAIDRILQMPSSEDSRAVFEGRSTPFQNYETTVGNIKNDTSLIQFNVQVQARLDLIRDDLETHYGITDADIVEVPGAYEEYNSFGDAVAYHPSVVNLMPVPVDSGDIHFIVPDPEGPSGNDVWRQDAETALNSLGPSSDIHLHFADVFFSYHTGLGAVHCGLNTVRTPPNRRWWED